MFGRPTAAVFRVGALFAPRRATTALPLRWYATAGRPRSTVGEPSRPVKRTAKAGVSASASRSATPGGKQGSAKATKGETKAKKVAAKKPAKTRVLTEKQKAAKKQREEKAKLTQLKEAALVPPAIKRAGAYLAFSADKRSGMASGTSPTREQHVEKFREDAREVARQFKSLSPAEVAHWNHVANSKRETSLAEYKQWVQSHTREEIQQANAARRALRRLEPAGKGRVRKWSEIRDERRTKPPISGYMRFVVTRQRSGDFHHIEVTERFRLIAQEWKELGESERKKYNEIASEDDSGYGSEFGSAYGRSPTAAAAGAA